MVVIMEIKVKSEEGVETNVSAVDALKALKNGGSKVTVEVTKTRGR
jgi:hypothetical protein